MEKNKIIKVIEAHIADRVTKHPHHKPGQFSQAMSDLSPKERADIFFLLRELANLAGLEIKCDHSQLEHNDRGYKKCQKCSAESWTCKKEGEGFMGADIEEWSDWKVYGISIPVK